MSEQYNIQICSDDAHDNVFCTIRVNDDWFIDITNEEQGIEVVVHPRPDNEPWVIGFDELISLLTRNRDYLVGG